jgi:hypothetical protein
MQQQATVSHKKSNMGENNGGTQFWSIFADGWKNWREKYRIMRTLFVV